VFTCALALYLATSYAGIRSPDSETVFEVCDALRSRGRVSIEDPAGRRSFGVARGLDGHPYAVFGPLESVLCVPFLLTADAVGGTGWYDSIGYLPPSLYVGDGLKALLLDRPISTQRREHARRTLTAWWMNSLIGAFGVLVFFELASHLAGGRQASALLVTAIYGAGTLAWPYAGTFFSEPLATLLVLAALERLVRADPAPGTAGLALGLATCAHITAILFAPFFVLLASGRRWLSWREVSRFALGLGGPLALLGLYNFARFGDPLETGRGAGLAYASWIAPWDGLWGLLTSPGKGLLLFCPAVLLGLWAWSHLHRERPRLAAVLATAALARWVLIAARSDWTGGYGVGPRYLVMLVPILLLPLVPWLEHDLVRGRGGRWLAALAVGFVATVQQAYFVIGEVFSFLHICREEFVKRGLDVFEGNLLYTDWTLSPLFRFQLLAGRRGPFLLHDVPLSNAALWLLFATMALLAWGLAALRRPGIDTRSRDPERVRPTATT
jgi:membrane protein YdbS with pleckstrin-like domain